MRQTAAEEAYRRFDTMATKQTEQLRKLTKQVSAFFRVIFISCVEFLRCFDATLMCTVL
jgi:hypothetical protein